MCTQRFDNLFGVRNGVVKEDGWSDSIEEEREVCAMSNVCCITRAPKQRRAPRRPHEREAAARREVMRTTAACVDFGQRSAQADVQTHRPPSVHFR